MRVQPDKTFRIRKKTQMLKEMLGPNVTIATAGHPILPELREQTYQYNMTGSIITKIKKLCCKPF